MSTQPIESRPAPEDFEDESDLDIPMSDELVARTVALLRPHLSSTA